LHISDRGSVSHRYKVYFCSHLGKRGFVSGGCGADRYKHKDLTEIALKYRNLED
jgi:hypothetical protein